MEAVTRVSGPDEVQFHIVDMRRGLLDAVPEQYIATHAMSASDVEASVAALQETLLTRVAPAGATRRELAERSHVTGPELVLVIDDDDIVDSYALRPLVASVAVAWDMKFHVVLARRPANAAFDGIATVLVSAGAVCLEMNEANRSLVRSRAVTLPPGRAHLLERGQQPLLIMQLIHTSEDDQSAETQQETLRHAGS